MSHPASYSSLGQYSSAYNGQCNAAAPQKPGELVDTRLIPVFGGIGNERLSHNLGNACMNDGYFSMCNAYPNCGDNCSPVVRPMCGKK